VNNFKLCRVNDFTDVILTVFDVIQKRGSIRKYKDISIPNSDLQTILESARLAQSAANRQPWQFIVISDKAQLEKLVDAAHRPGRPPQSSVSTAQTVIICLADPEMSRPVGPFDGFLVDLAIAIENMALTAWDVGIGSCWIGAFQEDKVKALLNIPENLRVVSLLTLGYADEQPRPKNRKRLNEIIYYQQYGQKNPN
jgi:nitroreductase